MWEWAGRVVVGDACRSRLKALVSLSKLGFALVKVTTSAPTMTPTTTRATMAVSRSRMWRVTARR